MLRVLVVGGSLSVRNMVEQALEMKRFEVLFASTGAEAMERIGTAMSDLVVCDAVTPDVDGYRVLRDPIALGKFRHYAETALPDLLRSM